MAEIILCAVEGCINKANAAGAGSRGLCGPHYLRLIRHGDPLGGGSSRVRNRPCAIDGCERKHAARGYCATHLARYKKYGDAEAYSDGFNRCKRWIEDHKSYDGDNCIEWPYAKSETGRGVVSMAIFGCRSAPRAMCIAAHGEPPEKDSESAHTCGNGHLGCMNPRHLRWATHMENVKDRADHGRDRMGAQINTNKLTEAQVIEIRARKGKQSGVSLAREFGVTTSNISDILRGKSWKHLL